MRPSFAILVILTFTGVRYALACSCGPQAPPLKALAAADAVFSGTVSDVVHKMVPRGPRTVENVEVMVRVAKSWKGEVVGAALVYTGLGMGDCGFQFDTGEDYLFYVYRTPEGRWQTDVCTRTVLLKNAANEVLELEGRLPALTIPAQEPLLELRGTTKDAGYEGYVFTMRNRLHERIFYFEGHFRIQVQKDGKWVDYPPNHHVAPRPELSPAAAAKELEQWKNAYDELQPEHSASFVDRQTSRAVFAAVPTKSATWRVGYQYVTEHELDAGAELQASDHFVWSAPIEPNTASTPLSFEQAFGLDSEQR